VIAHPSRRRVYISGGGDGTDEDDIVGGVRRIQRAAGITFPEDKS